MKNWMLGAAVVIGGLGLGATTAHAAEFGIYARGPVAYIPPCPGPGHAWVAGYWNGGYWVPGRWNYIGDRGHFARFDGGRDREFARHFDRDRDHFRR